MEDTSSFSISTTTEDVDKNTVPPSVTVFKNDNIKEETWTKYDNTYRLLKTGCGMTLLKRVERLESQMESQDYRHCLAKKEADKQRKRLHNYSKEAKEDVKDEKFIMDNINSMMNSKLDDKIESLQDYTENAVE